MASSSADAAVEAFEGGQLLFVGGTDWKEIGRSKGVNAEREEHYPNLWLPHKLKNLLDIKVMFVAAGPAAVHALIGDSSGNVWTWGRNEKGQLGQGDLTNRNIPTIVVSPLLEGKKVTGAAGGRHHSVVMTQDGESFSWGLNQQGQLGMGALKKMPAVKGFEDVQTSPVKALVSDVTQVSAGVDFTLWLCNGKIKSAGNPQYGQTGDGDDHQYNAKESSIQMCFEPQHTPKTVKGPLSEKTVTRITCGQQHSIAVDNEGGAWSWGNGGYGRLGHKVQQDEHLPRRLEEGLKGRVTVPAGSIVVASTTASFCNSNIGVHSWGKLKANGDNQMYPAVLYDLSGWNVRSMACGPNHFVVAADNSTITWGQATNGELGYGQQKKSSANAAKCEAVEGIQMYQVAAGAGFSLFLAPNSTEEDKNKLKKFEVFASSAPEEVPAPEGGKRKAEGAAAGKGKKAK